jgi:TRAP-type transport system small permease protein
MLKIVSNLFVLIFALVLVYWGIKFVRFGWYQESELAELPMPFIFVAWPLAGVSWVIFLGEIFFDNIRIVAGKAAGVVSCGSRLVHTPPIALNILA